jgi:small GTP-binding protein
MLDKNVKIQVFDTAGQDRLMTITRSYYNKAQVILLVFDCTDERSFDATSRWIETIDDQAGESVIKVLIANKIDLKNRIITTE